MNNRFFQYDPTAAFSEQMHLNNPDLPLHSYTISNVTDVGETANPNTTALLTGNGVGSVGKATVAFNRMNPKNTFGKFGSVVKRPVVEVFGIGGYGAGQVVSLSTLATTISRILGLSLTTNGLAPDVDGTQAITLPAVGSYVDADIPTLATSLRFRPSATDKLQVRLKNTGKQWQGMINDDVRSRVSRNPAEVDSGLVTYLPLDTDLRSLYAGATSVVTYATGQNLDVSGDALLGASSTTIAPSELPVVAGQTISNYTFNKTLVDSITGSTASSVGLASWGTDDAARGGQALFFGGGSAQKITAPADSAANLKNAIGGTNSWTIEFDAYLPPPTVAYSAILSMYSGNAWGTGDNWGIFIQSGGTLFMHAESGNVGTWIGYVNGMADSKWHKYAIVRDGTAIRMYVDGALKYSGTYTGSINANSISAIFGNNAAGSQPLIGRLRSFKVSNVALYNADYQPLKNYGNAVAKANLVKMTAAELASSTWTMVSSIVPATSEPVGTSVRWLFSSSGGYYRYDASLKSLVPVNITDINTKGYTTAELAALVELRFSGVAKLGLAASLITDGSATPTVTTVTLNYAKTGTVTTFGSVAPAPNAACSLRNGLGTYFNGGGIDIARDLVNCRVDLDALIQTPANNFTVEVDLQRSAVGGTSYESIFWNCYDSTGDVDSIFLGINQSVNKITFGIVDTASAWQGMDSSLTISDLLPHKLELVRLNGVYYIFIDGASAGVFTPTKSLKTTATRFKIGYGRTDTAGVNAGFARPFRGYMRDFKIYNYARYTAAHAVDLATMLDPGRITLLEGSRSPMAQAQRSVSALLYNVDFRPTITAIGLTKITSESTTTALGGSVVTAINAKLAALGIGLVFPTTIPLVGQTVSGLLSLAPVALGQNTKMSNVIVLSTQGATRDPALTVGDTVTLHLK